MPGALDTLVVKFQLPVSVNVVGSIINGQAYTTGLHYKTVWCLAIQWNFVCCSG